MHVRKRIVTLLILGFASTFSVAKSEDANSLWKIQGTLAPKKYVDLVWGGFFLGAFRTCRAVGTHVDPPAHFVKGLRTVDQIDLKEMILSLVVIDIHEEAAKNPDYTFSLDRVKKWEKDHGQIPAGAFVAMRADWSKRWPDARRITHARRTF